MRGRSAVQRPAHYNWVVLAPLRPLTPWWWGGLQWQRGVSTGWRHAMTRQPRARPCACLSSSRLNRLYPVLLAEYRNFSLGQQAQRVL